MSKVPTRRGKWGGIPSRGTNIDRERRQESRGKKKQFIWITVWTTPPARRIRRQKLLLCRRRTYEYILTWLLTRKAMKGVEQRGDMLRTPMWELVLTLKITYLLKQNCWAPRSVSFWVGRGWGPRIFISNTLPDDANAAGLGTTTWEPLTE